MTAKMVAVGYAASLPISEERSLFEFETAVPQAEATATCWCGSRRCPSTRSTTRCACASRAPRPSRVILGWDAAGIVEAVGPRLHACSSPGDEVYYAGNINRPGSNAQFHLVDERIVGRKPEVARFRRGRRAAAHHDHRLGACSTASASKRGEGADRRSLLIVGGAGGVGSIAIQLARKLTGLTVIATASRPETAEWCRSWARTTSSTTASRSLRS